MDAGRMGGFFLDLSSFDHEMAAYGKDSKQMRFAYNYQRFASMDEVRAFQPELVINTVTVEYTISVFKEVVPYLPTNCTLSDISLVKIGLRVFYEQAGHPYVSAHLMFGPTFASLNQSNEENVTIISGGDYIGRIFFKDLYQRLRLHIYEYTFGEHDRIVAYSLSIPFVNMFVFVTVIRHQGAPGTTFKRHMCITRGVLNEDDHLLQEMPFSPYMHDQVSQTRVELKELLNIIDNKDVEGVKEYLAKVRQSMREDS